MKFAAFQVLRHGQRAHHDARLQGEHGTGRTRENVAQGATRDLPANLVPEQGQLRFVPGFWRINAGRDRPAAKPGRDCLPCHYLKFEVAGPELRLSRVPFAQLALQERLLPGQVPCQRFPGQVLQDREAEFDRSRTRFSTAGYRSNSASRSCST